MSDRAQRGRVVLALVLVLVLEAGCGGDATPPGPERDGSFVAWYQAAGPVRQVALVADFNDWDPLATRLTPAGENGLYAVRVSPPAGLHRYRLVADGVEALDPYNPLTLIDDDGREASAMRIPDCTRPAWEVLSVRVNPQGEATIDLRFLRARSQRPLDPRSLVTSGFGAQVPARVIDAASGRLTVRVLGLPTGKHRLRVAAKDTAGVAAEPLQVPFWVEADPFDWQDALIYQVVVDRFRRGGGALDGTAPISYYHGGDLAGVVEAIEAGYFERLGVNTLWVSPLYQNPAGHFPRPGGHDAEAYHGYWPSEPRAVEDRFGGEAAVDALVAAAHAHGLRVLMDAVLNHVHEQHPYCRDHRGDGWFNHPDGDCICGVSCSWATDIEDCWFDPFLPDLRWESTTVVEQLTGDAVWWLDRFDLDGLRLDAVPMMPRLATRHLRDAVHRQLETGGTPVYLVGETYTQKGGQAQIRWYLGPQGLSGQFDSPVMWALRDGLAGRASLADLDAEVARSAAAWAGSGAVMAPILGSHDVPRFLSDMNGDGGGDPWTAPAATPAEDKPYQLLALAFTFLLTQPGAPVIYYGDEIGTPGAGDPDNRRDMRWGDLAPGEAALLATVQRLGAARRCAVALRRGERRTLLANENLYVYGRDAGDGRVALVALNRATVARALRLEVPADWSLADGAALTDLFGAAVTTTGRTVALTVPPRGAALALTETACGGK
jgi:glycosidase